MEFLPRDTQELLSQRGSGFKAVWLQNPSSHHYVMLPLATFRETSNSTSTYLLSTTPDLEEDRGVNHDACKELTGTSHVKQGQGYSKTFISEPP